MKRTPSPKQLEALKSVADGNFFPDLVREEDGWYARWRSVGGDNPWIDEYVRSAALTPLNADAEHQKHETLHDAWFAALRSRTGAVVWDDGECAEFAAELAEWHGGGEGTDKSAIVFTFSGRNSDGDDAFEISLSVPKGRKALKALGQAVYVFGPLRGLKRRADRLVLSLTRGEAQSFLASGARELMKAGYRVEGAELAAEVTAAAELDSKEDAKGRKTAGAKLVVKVAGEPVTAAEIRFLLEQGSSLVFFHDHWIEVDRSILREALRALERSGAVKLSRTEAIAFALGVGRIGRLEIEEVASHGWLRGLVEDLARSGSRLQATASVAGLNGALRPYQMRGASWMEFLTENGFGALLADDMGLGKTIQTIAWMLSVKSRPMLVVAPLTLIGNWVHEIRKFAPGLKVYVHHGEARRIGPGFRQAAREADVTITSYNMLVREQFSFSEVKWSGMVLDEAQAIKNADTLVARAVKSLLPPRRIALTGTPVENSVADIWSLEEFLNPGFLGDRKTFADRFVKPLKANSQSVAAKRLRHALEPFILRRLKSDGEVAAELGEKREIREYCALSSAERAAYEAALADFRTRERTKGDVFALITELKLICDGSPEGGKFARLEELVRTILENGESVLVFTQYAKVGAFLAEALAKRLGMKVNFLHGGLSAAAREREISSFNSSSRPGVFVLSLKAGGYGLNLVKATHVIHYDRWWNPAAENQATDRAHRIGQTKTVFVHLMMAAGTLEEHVDEILSRKSSLAGTVVESGEQFLMKMSGEEFDRTVSLDAET